MIGFVLVFNLVLYIKSGNSSLFTGAVLSGSSLSTPSSPTYEVFFSTKKQVILTRIKSLLSHVQGFGIYTNGFLTFFSFSKNFDVYFLFGIEYIMVITVCGLLSSLIFLNYRTNSALIGAKY